MPKLRPENVPYTKAEINEILSLKGWLKSQIDVFNLYAVLTIGVTNNTRWPRRLMGSHTENLFRKSLRHQT